MSKEYLLFFSPNHSGFRLPELQSLCELLDIKLSYDSETLDLSSPFMRAFMPSDEVAKRLASRAMLLKAVYELWAEAPNYEQLHEAMQTDERVRALWSPYATSPDTKFKFTPIGFNCTIPIPRQREIIQSFSWMDFKGPVDLKNPEVDVSVLEDWPEPILPAGQALPHLRKRVFVGRKIADGQRHLIDRFDLKKRVYIGNTSMEAEMSLLMANQAKASPGKLCYDPFVGTGSMLYTSAYFGARVMGSDIDGRQVRGKKGKSVFDSAAQYGVRDRVLDCLTFDLTQHPLRIGGFLDAIVTDPPYGVRAGAKRLGRKDESKLKDEPWLLEDGTYSHQRPDFVPPCKPWEMSEVLVELLQQALHLLKPGGRLVYWLPTVTAEYKDSDVPQLKGLELIGNSEQNYGKWSRRLITMRKLEEHEIRTRAEAATAALQPSLTPAHYDFRTSFYTKFENPVASLKATNGSA